MQSLQYAFEEKVMSDATPPLNRYGGFLGHYSVQCPISPAQHEWEDQLHRNHNTYAMLSNPLNDGCSSGISISGNMLCASSPSCSTPCAHILDNFRPATVWSTDLFIYYSVTTSLGKHGCPYYPTCCSCFVRHCHRNARMLARSS